MTVLVNGASVGRTALAVGQADGRIGVHVAAGGDVRVGALSVESAISAMVRWWHRPIPVPRAREIQSFIRDSFACRSAGQVLIAKTSSILTHMGHFAPSPRE
jgi:hypothetical protein